MMHKKIKFSLAFVVLIQVFFGQVTITIPSANNNIVGLSHTEWRKPLGSYDGYERSAIIFKHSEIGQYGQINLISFYCDTSIHSPGNTPVNIYMKEITDSVFLQASKVANEEMGTQLVYSGTLPSSAFVIHQWTIINFSNPFIHATSKPLEVIIETNAGGSGNENNLSKSFYHSLYTLNNFQYWSADNNPPAGVGTLSKNRPNVQLGFTTIPACSGTPNGGTTLSSVDTTCSSVSFSLQGNTAALGLNYQWQDSLAGGSWTNISFANNSTLTTSINADSWFRCRVSCSAQSAYSTVKNIVLRNYLQCYCTANLGGGCSFGGAIDSVAIVNTGLVTSHTGCSTNNYMQYPASGNTCAQLASGQNYNLHTRFDGNTAASAWIDYDQNGMFDISEWKRINSNTKIDSDYVTLLSVPINAKTGLTLMRIRSRSAGNSNDSADACTNFGSGETEDYFIGINYAVGISGGIKNDEKTFYAYPNPASNTLYISSNITVNEGIILQLYTIEGGLLASRNIYNDKPFILDVSAYESGIYFLRLSGQDLSIVKKVIIKR